MVNKEIIDVGQLAHKQQRRVTNLIEMAKVKYQPDGVESLLSLVSKVCFFSIAGALNPQLVAELKNRPFAAYSELQLRNSRNKGRIDWETEEVNKLQEALLVWSQAFNLDAEWCRRFAIAAMKGWSDEYWRVEGLDLTDHPDLFETIERFSVPRPNLISYTPQPPKHLPIYDPCKDSRESYLDWVKEKAGSEVEALELPGLTRDKKYRLVQGASEEATKYCAAVENVYESAMRPARRIKELPRNIEWAVRYQVNQVSFTDIAKELGIEPSTVKRDVEVVLGLINLPRRPAKRTGRKKGSKETERSTRQILKGRKL